MTENEQLYHTLRQRLKSLILPMTRMIPVRSDEANFEKSSLMSHFNGVPYFEVGDKWPYNKITKRPLDFVLQVINSPKLPLADDVAVLQFFYDWRNPAYTHKQGGWFIRTYSQIRPKRMVVPEKPYRQNFCKIHFEPGLSIPDWESIDHYVQGFTDLCLQLDRLKPWEVYAGLKAEVVGQQEISSQLGGYPQWIQCFATPRFDNRWAYFLAQIDTEDQAYLRFGDMGSVYLFQNDRLTDEYGFVLQTL